jgi:hypothetical protein
MTLARTAPPIIMLHPAVLGGSETAHPWGIDAGVLGKAFAYETLLHECMHVKVRLTDGWKAKGTTSHNNDLWIAEVNRLAPLLGLEEVEAQRSRLKRQGNRVIRGTEGNIPFAAVTQFPYGVRKFQNRLDWYRGENSEIPR